MNRAKRGSKQQVQIGPRDAERFLGGNLGFKLAEVAGLAVYFDPEARFEVRVRGVCRGAVGSVDCK